MSRSPRIISIDESRLRKPGNTSAGVPGSHKPDVPYRKVHALVLGVLFYVDKPTQRYKLRRVSGDVLVDTVLTALDQEASSETDGPEEVSRLAHIVHDRIESLLHHPAQNTLAAESAWLLPKLAGYGSIQGVGEQLTNKREKWLVEHLPALLHGLLVDHVCPFMKCPTRTTIPNKQELEKWTEKNRVKEVRLHILAYYHGCTYAVVKERFHRATRRRASTRKAPTTR